MADAPTDQPASSAPASPDAAGSGPQAQTGPAFTLKALAFGLLLALVVVVLGWFNDQYLRQSPAIGNFLPALPFGLALALALGWNPILGRIQALRFSTRELAVAMALMLLVSWLPTSGFFRYFQRAIITGHAQADTNPQWRKLDIIGHLPAHLFPLGGSAEVQAMGLAQVAERSALSAGALDQELAKAQVDRAAYLAALDLAAYVPPKLWQGDDQELLRANTERAWQRDQGRDPARWAAAGELLKGMPADLRPSESAPAAWRLAHARLSAVFAERLPQARKEYERVYTGFTQGLPVGDDILPLSEMPTRAWLPALAFWAPLILLFTLAIVMLTLIVHRQWSHHEQLTYPIAQVASALMQRSGSSLFSDIVRNRLFWFGLAPVFGLHMLNYLAVWFPGWVPNVTLHWWQGGMVSSLFPTVNQAGGSVSLAQGHIYFAVVGLCFFIASEVSFTMGVVGMVVVFFNIQYYLTTGATTDLPSARSGAYIGYALVLLYTGRTYYWAVLTKALGLHGGAAGDHAEPVWAARIFLLAFAGFAAVLVGAFGLDWFVALAYALTLMIFFLVLARMVCETGIPFLQTGWQPAQLLANTLGISAVGAAPLVMLCYLGTILSQDPRECLMPFAANAMKVAENAGVRRLRLALIGFGVIAVALVVGWIAITWGMYNFGSTRDSWAQGVVASSLNEASRGVTTLVETGQYAASSAASGLEKLPLITDNVGKTKELGWIGFGLVGVVFLALIRFRWAGFYLHPVLLLVWDTYPAQMLWLSCLLGWIAKELVVRFGGGRVYQNLKPLFIGIICGELVAVVVTLGVGWVYFVVTGLMPKTMSIFAG
ncbi:MAG: hypothetical protein J0M02_16495 [Planctomycetes bacterium]|nr:hypothetical protein [Planctomycetota bacterium]